MSLSNYEKWYVENKSFYEQNDKDVVIKRMVKDLKLKYTTAKTYYFKIKENYMKDANLLKAIENIKNTKVKIIKKENEKVYIEGQYSQYLKSDKKLVAGDVEFNSEEQIRVWAQNEVDNFLKNVVPELMYVYKMNC